MAYFAPYIDATGLHNPEYSDIQAYEWQQFLSVYGQNTYDGTDNADVQWVDIFALMINDAFQAAQLAYNARSPKTAVGSDLDGVVGINGIARKAPSSSTVTLTLTGVPNTQIVNGAALDQNNNLWAFATVTIPNTGTINVQATCLTNGAITAPPNTINIPAQGLTAGWTGVTNAAAAIIGSAVESDSQLRARQAVSVAISSKTLVQATIGAIAGVKGVTRYATGIPTTPPSAATSVENPTGANDSFGNPPHSISMVVEGGADADIATAIYNNKAPGCLTNGTTTVNVTDPVSGAVMGISFFRPTYVPIFATLTVNPLNGFTSATALAIQTAVVNYLNALQIGESLTISGLYAAAMAVMPDITQPQFSITGLVAGTTLGGQGTADIVIAFNTVVQGITANVVVNS